jgi:hypothetical protein
MDYAEHERTYAEFIRFATIGTVWTLIIVVGLAIGATAHRWGLASFLILLGTVAGGLGVAVKSLSAKPATGVLGLSLLLWLLTAH